MGKKKTVITLAELINTVKGDFRQWREIYTSGCADPNWEDGVNLDLVRNHIIYDLNEANKCAENTGVKPWALPDELFYPIPPQFPQDFMAVDRKLLSGMHKANKSMSYNEVMANFDWKVEFIGC